ncbi:MAG TPA: antibiotic biosynthesis monooxygenase [Streptosporangiaceae bacterium]|nr:antibiotic biosynthesis monooxygenase [Streptosporangiaceae bacterium]
MTASLIVVALGAVVAAVGTGVLAARSARAPRIFLVAWTIALFALAVALAAQALGYLAGYSDLMFRAMELGIQAIAPLALCLGLVELIAWGMPGRFAMRLAVSAIGVIVLVILGTDPLSTTSPLSTSWPDPEKFYQLIPLGLIDFLAGFTLATALISAVVVMARSGRGRAYEEVVRSALLACGAAIAVSLPGLMMFAHITFGGSVFSLAAAAAAVLTWVAAVTASRRGLADDRAAADRDRRRPAGPAWYDSDDRPDDRYDNLVDDYLTSAYRDDAAHRGRPDDDLAYPALAALAAERSDPARRHDPDVYDSSQFDSAQFDSGQYDDSGRFDSAEFDSAQFDSAQFDSPEFDSAQFDSAQFDSAQARSQPQPASNHQGQLFGQITIYTLLDDRLADFDRMTEQVVEQVRSLEPGTLVYIVHAVPTAPMQRILYEVYRDRAAYDEHMAQPYVARYVAERRSMVLATNAIELGLQQAKISPLPSYSAISDILSESGIDLTGVTKSSRAGRDRLPSRDAAARGGERGRTEPREQPVRPPRGQDEPGYEGWVAGLPGEDPWYR